MRKLTRIMVELIGGPADGRRYDYSSIGVPTCIPVRYNGRSHQYIFSHFGDDATIYLVLKEPHACSRPDRGPG